MLSVSDRRLVEHVAAVQGFEIAGQSSSALLSLSSSLVPGEVTVDRESKSFLITVDLPLVDAALHQEFDHGSSGAIRAADESELYRVLGRAFQLCATLPDEPLQKFEAATNGLPRSTESERLVLQRIGQSIFRDALEGYWQGRCAVSGIEDRGLLRASHIKPWADSTDTERLDVYNGILLTAHLDAAFDKHLMTISPSGELIFSSGRLSQAGLDLLRPKGAADPIRLFPQHQAYLTHHRARFEQLEAGGA